MVVVVGGGGEVNINEGSVTKTYYIIEKGVVDRVGKNSRRNVCSGLVMKCIVNY